MTQIINRHWWEDFYNIARTDHKQCLTCQVHNAKKIVFVSRDRRPLPFGPYEHLQLDFINCHLIWAVNMSLFCLYVFLDGLKLFPTASLLPLQWKKNMFKNVLPIWGTPSIISNDWGTHFTGQITWALIKALKLLKILAIYYFLLTIVVLCYNIQLLLSR